MKKNILCLLLILAMLLGSLSTTAFGTEKTEDQAATDAARCSLTEGCALESGHKGECVLHETRYQTAKDGEWFYGTLADACVGVYSGGTVQVLRDIELEAGITARKPMTITSASDTPCKIFYTSNSEHDPFALAIALEKDNDEMTLRNIIFDGGRETGRITHTELVGVRNGTLILENGAILQNNDNVDTAEGSGGLRVINSSTAIMKPGSIIQNCRAVAGGGAAVASENATLAMLGGTIEYCEAFFGGGVYVRGKGKFFFQNGSTIRGNAAKEQMDGMHTSNPFAGSGGGIFLENCSGMGMQDSLLTDNTADFAGGGMYVNCGLVQLMSGTTTGNHAGKYGGGVALSPYASVMVGGTPQITGNTSGEKYFDNIYLDGDDTSTHNATRPLYIAASLKGAASIGISRWVQPDADNPYRIIAVPANSYAISDSDLAKFHSDDPRYIVLRKDGNLVLTTAQVLFDNQNHGPVIPGQELDENHLIHEPDKAQMTERGYVFEGWYKEPACTPESRWDFNTAVTEGENDQRPILTLYAKWNLLRYEIVYNLEGGQNAADNPEAYTVESDDIILKAPTRDGYRFLGWKLVDVAEDIALLDTAVTPAAGSAESEADIPAGSIGKRTFEAQWEALPQTPDPPAHEDDDPSVTPAPNPPTDPTPEQPTDPAPGEPVNPEPTTPIEPAPGEPAKPAPTTPAEPSPTAPTKPAPTAPTQSATSTTDLVPKTGDPANMALWAFCALSALAGIALLLRFNRGRN